MIRPYDFVHSLLNGLQLFGREGFGDLEVVVESAVNGRAEADACAGDQLAHRGGEDVGRGMAQNAEGLGIALGEEADRSAVLEGAHEVDDLPVHDGSQGGPRESGSDLGGQHRGVPPSRQLDGPAIGQGDVDLFALHAGRVYIGGGHGLPVTLPRGCSPRLGRSAWREAMS